MADLAAPSSASTPFNHPRRRRHGTSDRSRPPEQYLLIQAIGYDKPDLQMPPKGKLPAEHLADLTAWVKMGAPWPEEAASQKPAGSAGSIGFDLEMRRRGHWAWWRPIQNYDPPAVKDTSWPRRPIDHFLLSKLEAKGLKPAPPADVTAGGPF